ncbi:LRR receptor-like serine/threonine-protein kinase FEI 1 isoform X2 [Papaver somniferum]|uniref:LRR receptor-like serine/threonine-protein kinase FEI 1 isoform X2 n=1 Tax=Papaver somniferum TaxID=3469 RepID=UPI000E705DA0|nr:LRR receptor-like serine/threonine-protein kinase FEI 1 isoform X2 [Papaver somniferum]
MTICPRMVHYVAGMAVNVISSLIFITVENRGLFSYTVRGQRLWSAGPVLYRYGYHVGCSFIGNLDLCDPQIMKPYQGSLVFPAMLLHSPHAESEEAPCRDPYWSNISNGSSHCYSVLFLLDSLIGKERKSSKKINEVKKQTTMDERTKVVLFHGDLPYSSSDIVEKLESLDVEDVLGSGGFGTVYTMMMNDRTRFVVKGNR